MNEYLTFLLSGTLASFGSYAGHERRGSDLVPMRSAILGLVGAALGIDRADAEGQAALGAYSSAVQPFKRTAALRDYHTVQTVPTTKAKRPRTRRDALATANRNINTIITIRDYRCDVLIGVVLWGDGRWSLNHLSSKLRHPTFPLYLGRKSCPLTNPLGPKIVRAEGPDIALASIEVPEFLRSNGWSETERLDFNVTSDPFDGPIRPPVTERLPCEPLDRQAWTFGERTVWQLGGRCKAPKSDEGDK